MTTLLDTKQYELMLIFSGDLTEADFAKEFAAVKSMVKASSEVTHEENWGMRRFPFKINKLMRGYYGVLNFAGDPSVLAELRESLKLNPVVVRSLIMVMPKDYKPGSHTDEVIPVPVVEEEDSQKRPHRKVDDVEKRPRPVESIKHQAPSSDEEAPATPAAPAMSRDEQEESLKTVEKRLDDILDDPDLKL